MLEALDAGAVRGWCRSAADALSSARADIDSLNVFPVADGDTGTNLHLTMEAVAEAAEKPPPGGEGETELAATWRAVARGALLGARGNSGVIVSQVWRGLAEVLPVAGPCRGLALGEGLRHAASLAYAAVAKPVEGTLLTVVRAAGEATTGRGDDLGAVARAAADGARSALDRTTGQLDALTRAGVVDAGGAGLCVILDALVSTVSGRLPDSAHRSVVGVPESNPPVDAGTSAPAEGPAYEVMYLLDARQEEVGQLRVRLGELGDSLVVVGGEQLWNVHVHVDDAGAAIEAGMSAGRPHRIQVSYLRPEVPHPAAYGRAVVAVAAGGGAAELFARAGAAVVRRGPEGSPTLGQMLDAIRHAGDEVVVLPNEPEARSAAEAAAVRARDDGRHVSVVPTRATVQGLAALAVHDRQRRFEDDVIAMTAAAGATRFGEVTVASGPAVTSAGICRAGDVLGLIDGDVAVIGSDVRTIAVDLVDRMLSGGGELVTMVTGEDAFEGLADALLSHLRRSRPDVDVAAYTGGQPGCTLLVGVE